VEIPIAPKLVTKLPIDCILPARSVRRNDMCVRQKGSNPDWSDFRVRASHPLGSRGCDGRGKFIAPNISSRGCGLSGSVRIVECVTGNSSGAMVRQQFSAPEESTRERQRDLVIQTELVLFGAFAGAFLGSIFGRMELVGKLAILIGLLALVIITNRYWERIYAGWSLAGR
jgi:Na+-transporting NADH:ubiquinone oxidoreductase subunit NqrB